MIAGDKYIEKVKEFFSFLTEEFAFKVFEVKIRGNFFYDLQFIYNDLIVSISYENIEDYFQVILFKTENGVMPDYDDKSKTLHLNYLLTSLLPMINRVEMLENNEYFAKFVVKSVFERKVIKAAKELRLCLKHYDELK